MAEKREDMDGPTLPSSPAPAGKHAPGGPALGSDADHLPTLTSADGGPPPAVASSRLTGASRPADYTGLLPVDPAHYIRDRELARGGMGRVVVARDRRLGREVAIKELLAPTEELRARFEREARITARLQHPATVSLLEAGVWPTGEPFYSMRLIAGRPLDKVIAEAKTAEARFGLVANVLAVADTIAYAHDRKIVHRDLKPANVLVGEFGETVVIDWGLAKDLTATGADVETLRPSRRALLPSTASGSDAATEHGTVIGTPAYMPPEQAEGDAVDERADVYSLGALLYHVLAGEAPYTGSRAEHVLAAVISAPPPPLAARVPQAPPDLITIVEKAMARNPAHRFRTAKELAAELKTFQTGQLVGSHRYTPGQLVRRWVRKHRAPIAVGAIAVLALAVVGAIAVRNVVVAREVAERERARAEEQRAIAVQRDADAQELMTFMLGDLHDKLTAVGKLDLLESVAHKAVGYYEQRGGGDSSRDQVQRASALISIGDVLVSKGDPLAAKREFEKARAIDAELLAREPANGDAALGVANSDERLATVATAQDDPKAAEKLERSAIAELDALLARSPERADAGLVLLNARRALGDTLVDLGDGTGAGSAYRAAITFATAHLEKSPNEPRWQRALAIHHSQLGALLAIQGDGEGALREERADLELSQKLAAAHPEDTQAQNDLAGAHLRLGDYMKGSDPTAALAEFRASLAVMKHLTTLDPANNDWAHDRSACHDRVGTLLLAKNDFAGARAEYEAARDLRELMVERDPTSGERRNLAISHNKLGNVLETEHKPGAALAEYEHAHGLLELLAKADPANAALQRDLSVSLYLTADMLLATNNKPEGLARHRASLAISLALAQKDPTNAVWQGDVIEGHMAVAKALLANGQRADARTELEAGLALADAQAAKDKDNPAWADYGKQIHAALSGLK